MAWWAAIPAVMGAMQSGDSARNARSQNRIEAMKTRLNPILGTMGQNQSGDGGKATMAGIGAALNMYQNANQEEALGQKYAKPQNNAMAINTNAPQNPYGGGYNMQGPQRYDPIEGDLFGMTQQRWS